MNLAEVERLVAFFKEKPKLNEEIRELFSKPSFEILFNIMNNLKLFNFYKRSDSKKFLNILNALDNLTEDGILIFISELQLYGIFSPESYLNFTKTLQEKFEDDNMVSNPFQVVLNNKRQKLVFLCGNHVAGNEAADIVDKIAKLTQKHFGATISTIDSIEGIEMTVNKIIEGDERNTQFEIFLDAISKDEPILASKISLIRTIRDRDGYKYSTPKLDKNVSTMEELIKVLKTSQNITINAPIIINNNGNINIGEHNKIIQTFENKKETANKWIENNLPGEKEITTKYYEKYKTANPDFLVTNIFGKLVRNFGYKTVMGNGQRYWAK